MGVALGAAFAPILGAGVLACAAAGGFAFSLAASPSSAALAPVLGSLSVHMRLLLLTRKN